MAHRFANQQLITAIHYCETPYGKRSKHVSVRYEYRRKHVLREKMTPRRRVLAGIRRAIFAAGVLALIVLVLSGQDGTNTLQHGNSLEVSYLSQKFDISRVLSTLKTYVALFWIIRVQFMESQIFTSMDHLTSADHLKQRVLFWLAFWFQ